jgi:hypothetical protein
MAHLGVGAVTKVVEDEGVYQANVACHLLHPSQLSLLLRLCNFENQIRRDTRHAMVGLNEAKSRLALWVGGKLDHLAPLAIDVLPEKRIFYCRECVVLDLRLSFITLALLPKHPTSSDNPFAEKLDCTNLLPPTRSNPFWSLPAASKLVPIDPATLEFFTLKL